MLNSEKMKDVKTTEISIFIFASKYKWDSEFKITYEIYDITKFDSVAKDDDRIVILLDEVKVKVPAPQLSQDILTMAHIETLKNKIQQEKAASQNRITQLYEQIQELTALEYQQ